MFAEPWQAQAFGLAVQLNADGAFTWVEWAAALAAELARDPTDNGSRYYHTTGSRRSSGWSPSAALAAASELTARKAAWADAYRHTPHGKPVELS